MSSLTLWAWLVLTAAPSPQPSSVSGTVVDPEGKPVKGATVWLTAFVRFDADVEELAQVETDAEGRFTIDAPAGGGDRPRSLTLWAHAPGTRVAIASPSDRPKDDRGPIRLTLGPPAKTPVRVLGATASPWRGRPCGSRRSSAPPACGPGWRPRPTPGGARRSRGSTPGRSTASTSPPTGSAPRATTSRRTRQRRPCSSCRSAGSRCGSCPTTRRPWPAGRSSPRPSRRGEPSVSSDERGARPDRRSGPGRARAPRGGADRLPRRAARGLAVPTLPDVPAQAGAPRRRERRGQDPGQEGGQGRGIGARARQRQAGGRGEGRPQRPLALSEERGRGHRRRGPLLSVFLAMQAPREPDLVLRCPTAISTRPTTPLGRLRPRRGRGDAHARPAGGLAGGRDQGDGGRRGRQAGRGGPGERLVRRPAFRRPVDPGQHPDRRARGVRPGPDGARLDRRGPGAHQCPGRGAAGDRPARSPAACRTGRWRSGSSSGRPSPCAGGCSGRGAAGGRGAGEDLVPDGE